VIATQSPKGDALNHKKLFRLYREEKLTVRKRGGRKRAIGTRAPMLIPMAGNDHWSLDFVSDQLTDGRRFRVLTVVDHCTRECLALVADTSLSLPLQIQQPKTAGANSKPDKTWGQGHFNPGGHGSNRDP
jgi:transposase InsO family protein